MNWLLLFRAEAACLLALAVFLSDGKGRKEGRRFSRLSGLTALFLASDVLAALTLHSESRAAVLLRGGALILYLAAALALGINLWRSMGTGQKDSIDAMTGVENRNRYEADIPGYEAEYLADPSKRFIFLFADLNNLKSVNGLYGHEAGDRYITFIAATLRDHLRSAEHIYRMGGDEFLAVYRDVPEETVTREMDAIRKACLLQGEKREYVPKLAMGYAVSGSQYRSLHDVLRVADYMMYRNKAELKREVAMEAEHRGTNLNLTGLTDRIFEAMCTGSEEDCLFLLNLETGVARLAPGLQQLLGLADEFHPRLLEALTQKMNPEDREIFREAWTETLEGKRPRLHAAIRIPDPEGREIQAVCKGGVYRGRDGEPDYLAGMLSISK